MKLPLALALVTLIAIVGNRILAVAAAVWWRVPVKIFIPALLTVDLLQIPMFYWLYQNGSRALHRLPAPLNSWFKKEGSGSTIGRWASSLGGLGVMLVAAMPTFGGGMWSAVFLSYSLGLRRQVSYIWLVSGSVLSYVTIYWIVDTMVSAVRYFTHG